MAKVLVVTETTLPAPQAGFDVVLWRTSVLPSDAELRSWAGWAETALIAGSTETRTWVAYNSLLKEWSSSDLIMGAGRVWRLDHRYLAWVEAETLLVPEHGRALALAGVELIVSDSCQVMGSLPLDPVWRTIQANQIFGLRLTPEPLGMIPCEIDPSEEGSLAGERIPGGSAFDLNFTELATARRLYPMHPGLRPDLYRRARWWRP